MKKTPKMTRKELGKMMKKNVIYRTWLTQNLRKKMIQKRAKRWNQTKKTMTKKKIKSKNFCKTMNRRSMATRSLKKVTKVIWSKKWRKLHKTKHKPRTIRTGRCKRILLQSHPKSCHKIKARLKWMAKEAKARLLQLLKQRPMQLKKSNLKNCETQEV